LRVPAGIDAPLPPCDPIEHGERAAEKLCVETHRIDVQDACDLVHHDSLTVDACLSRSNATTVGNASGTSSVSARHPKSYALLREREDGLRHAGLDVEAHALSASPGVRSRRQVGAGARTSAPVEQVVARTL